MYNQEVKSWLKTIAMNQPATNPQTQITLRTPRILRTLRILRTPRTPRILRTPRIPRTLRTLRKIPIQEAKTEQRTVEQETPRTLTPTAKIHRTPILTAKTLLKTTHPLSTVIN